ncbi:MAG: hypothetical protein H6978_07095 [Gammaproteobacteria bacterium]|nr:hypothetical protein [Gammaproteobacteria bacterium]
MRNHGHAKVKATLLAALTATMPVLAAAGEPPDFTGVWTWHLAPGENPVQTLRAATANLPYTADVRPRVEEYQAMAKLALENPGSYCVQFGMPGAMLFSGGYPMEVIQRPE